MGGIVEFLKLLTLPFREGREERAGWVPVNIMLNYEDAPQASPSPAASVRVTPEELAAAITALQIRKEGQPGTIAIGDAVEELGLDVTPEEVLAEVQARRTAPGRRRFSLRQLSLRQRLGLYFAVGTLLIGLDCVWARLSVPSGPDMNVNSAVIVPYTVSLNPMPSHIKADPNLLVGDSSGKVVMLSEVGDNQPVHCCFDNGTVPVLTQYSPNAQTAWTLIKHNGKVYVRGWFLRVSPKVMAAFGVDMSSLNNSGFVVPVTLSLDQFVVTPDAGSSVEFHASDIHLDKHAYEKW